MKWTEFYQNNYSGYINVKQLKICMFCMSECGFLCDWGFLSLFVFVHAMHGKWFCDMFLFVYFETPVIYAVELSITSCFKHLIPVTRFILSCGITYRTNQVDIWYKFSTYPWCQAVSRFVFPFSRTKSGFQRAYNEVNVDKKFSTSDFL